MKIIDSARMKTFTFHNFELHKVYKSKDDGCYYVLVHISYDNGKQYYNCLLNLNTMKGNRMCDLSARSDEFSEVDYQFEVRNFNGFN